MLYQVRDTIKRAVFHPTAMALEGVKELVNHESNPLRDTFIGRFQSAVLESNARLLKQYPKPRYRIKKVDDGADVVPVDKTVVVSRPFGDLVKFKRRGSQGAPKVLFVAALSGHYATLACDTYREFLADHEVYVTDWVNARDVPLSEGTFGFDDYVSYLIEFIKSISGQVHVIGICQAAVPTLVAATVMAQNGDPHRPSSITLMAGPVDVRVNPIPVMRLAKYLKHGLFKVALRTVPDGYEGVGRKVYPGYEQLGVFLAMNLPTHLKNHVRFFVDLLFDKQERANKHREFYDEYMATMDGTAEFYLDTIDRVFLNQALADGTMTYKDELVDCSKVEDIALLTLEGAEDDMCRPGQTEAAHSLYHNVPATHRLHHVQEGVGHYGIFNGSIYKDRIAPMIKEFIAQSNKKRRTKMTSK